MKQKMTSRSSDPDTDQGLNNARSGDYDLTLRTILRDAWSMSMTGHSQRVAQLAGLYYGLTALAVLIIVLSPKLINADAHPSQSVLDLIELLSPGLIGQLILTAATLPMAAGLFMTGLKLARQRDVAATEVYRYFYCWGNLFIVGVISNLLTDLALLLLIIPGIYLWVAWTFALPLVAERGIGPLQALETSRKAVTHRWFTVFALHLIAASLAGACIAAMGFAWFSLNPLDVGNVIISLILLTALAVALVWTFPWLLIAYGLMYQKIFGEREADGTIG